MDNLVMAAIVQGTEYGFLIGGSAYLFYNYYIIDGVKTIQFFAKAG